MTTGTLALIIFGAIFTQIALLALIGLHRRSGRYRDSDTPGYQRNSTASEINQLSSAPAWQDYKEFLVQHCVDEDENRSIRSFYLVPVDGIPLPDYQPGQFLTFKLPVEGPSSHQAKSIVRCYSLSDRPGKDHYRISVKRVPAPADRPELPPGLSSNFLHDRINEGDRLLVKPPSGHFHLTADASLPIVLIAGGIGITPMLSILNTLMHRNDQREIWLYYGVRNGAEVVMREHLLDLAAGHDNFHFFLCYSDPREDEEAEKDYQHGGRIDIPLLRATLKLMRYQFYVCGPAAMMESLVPGLEEWGVAGEDIYYEAFGPATLNRRAQARPDRDTSTAEAVTVTFGNSGKSVQWDPQAGSLLEFAETQGIEVESGCRAGSCGSCQTAIASGEVEYSQQPDDDLDPGQCLLCISTPKSDLTLVA